MLKYKLFTIYVFFHTLLCGCSEPHKDGFDVLENAYSVKKVARLPEQVAESSGLAPAADGNFWTHNDAGNENTFFKINEDGKLLASEKIKGTKNKDWEALATDQNGHVYIGDFGNNSNKRKDLRVYKISEKDLQLQEEIQFSYPDQKAFPPPKKLRNFDCEAFFWHNNYLYLFSKNRGESDWVKMYRLPDSGGPHVAELLDSLNLTTHITGADISPSQKRAALLGYGYIYIFEFDDPVKMFKGKKYCIPVGKSGQAEAIVFLNENEFLFSNENDKIFKVSPKNK